ncbi:M56 family metallopeptidase [Bacillus sp. CGMCC 1.16541]|uniref:M48 family metallopeptidase n=1 Tax=Bacillus sp. CGMCC 1.16541 TaxID=2185143 RepID=UPI0013A59A04|nr:M56 family metallopeptidase [Bacillus sp. CGMCC 1.16541]
MDMAMSELVIGLLIGASMALIGSLFGSIAKNLGNAVEIIGGIISLYLLISVFNFNQIWLTIIMVVYSYFTFSELIPKKELRMTFKEKIAQSNAVVIEVNKSFKRVLADVSFILLFSSLSILFIIVGPETSNVLKMVLLFSVASLCSDGIKRIIQFYSIQLYFSEDEQMLYVMTRSDLKSYPLQHLNELHVESNVDLLRLFPLFTLLQTNKDYTTSFTKVLKLRFSGETIYLTVNDLERWTHVLKQYVNEQVEERRVESVFHKKQWRRLLGKGYFAITVKGISAYTTLIIVMYWLELSVWINVIVILFYWLFNLYISDKVLKVAMDAEEVKDSAILACAERVCLQANMKHVKVYQTESTDYNALATGMNVGRSMITLTSETMKLSIEHIEAIIAHEVAHIKSRDIMRLQLFRFLFLGGMGSIVYLSQDWLMSEDKPSFWIILVFVWVVMIGFTSYLSMISQIAEVRADHKASTYISGGRLQMARALEELTIRQDKNIDSALNFSFSTTTKDDPEPVNSLKREKWLWRLFEFQFMNHPPVYWRVKTLEEHHDGWGLSMFWVWWRDRCKESLPDLKKDR